MLLSHTLELSHVLELRRNITTIYNSFQRFAHRVLSAAGGYAAVGQWVRQFLDEGMADHSAKADCFSQIDRVAQYVCESLQRRSASLQQLTSLAPA